MNNDNKYRVFGALTGMIQALIYWFIVIACDIYTFRNRGLFDWMPYIVGFVLVIAYHFLNKLIEKKYLSNEDTEQYSDWRRGSNICMTILVILFLFTSIIDPLYGWTGFLNLQGVVYIIFLIQYVINNVLMIIVSNIIKHFTHRYLS